MKIWVKRQMLQQRKMMKATAEILYIDSNWIRIGPRWPAHSSPAHLKIQPRWRFAVEMMGRPLFLSSLSPPSTIASVGLLDFAGLPRLLREHHPCCLHPRSYPSCLHSGGGGGVVFCLCLHLCCPTQEDHHCARSSGAVHSVFLIDVYLDLENPGGSGFWVGENRRVTEGNK